MFGQKIIRLTILVSSQMQIRTTMKQITHSLKWLNIIKKPIILNIGEGTGTPIPWECNTVQALWNALWQFLINTQLQHDSAISFLEKSKHVHTKTYILMFIEVLYIKYWK